MILNLALTLVDVLGVKVGALYHLKETILLLFEVKHWYVLKQVVIVFM